MTATQARWPEAPADVRTLTGDDQFDAAVEAAVFAAVLDFRRTVGRVDGTRSSQILDWAAELERVAGGAA